MTFRIAVVQPISHRPPEDENNVAEAVRAVERAAGEGARFRLLSGKLSGSVAHAGDFRSDRGARGSRGQARRARGVRHDRADRCQSGDRL